MKTMKKVIPVSIKKEKTKWVTGLDRKEKGEKRACIVHSPLTGYKSISCLCLEHFTWPLIFSSKAFTYYKTFNITNQMHTRFLALCPKINFSSLRWSEWPGVYELNSVFIKHLSNIAMKINPITNWTQHCNWSHILAISRLRNKSNSSLFTFMYNIHKVMSSHSLGGWEK